MTTSRYVEITEDEFQSWAEAHGFALVAVPGVKENVYTHPVDSLGRLQVQVYSTIEAGVGRACGRDAIRALLVGPFGRIAGEKKVLRVPGMFERLTERVKALEQKGAYYARLYSQLEWADLTELASLEGEYGVLVRAREDLTRSNKPCYRLAFALPLRLAGSPLTVLMSVFPDYLPALLGEDWEVGKVYEFAACRMEMAFRAGGAILLGKYGFVFPDSGLQLKCVDSPRSRAERGLPGTLISAPAEPPSMASLSDAESRMAEPLPSVDSPAPLLSPNFVAPNGDAAPSPSEPIGGETSAEEPPAADDDSRPTSIVATPDAIPSPAAEGKKDAPPEVAPVPTTELQPYGLNYPWPTLNPMQSAVWRSEAIQRGDNLIVAAPTSSGKTQVAEMAIARALSNYKMAIYVAPLKALVEEKLQDWRSVFPGIRIGILTGDYELTEAQAKKLRENDIVVMTNEMLLSRATKYEHEKNTWLKEEVACIVFDEIHMIGSQGRGDKTEVAIMQFCSINPRAQVVMLSATISDLDKLQQWVTTLTGRETVVLKHEYRPCVLRLHTETYDDSRGVWDQEAKIAVTKAVLEENPKDKYLIFTPSRKESERTATILRELGYNAAHHNAELSLDERRDVEERFKNGDLQIIASTPTLAMGVNLPARRVIVQGTYRGINEIDPTEVHQCAGRAGRPKYDTEGDATILVPMSRRDYEEQRLQGVRIGSVLAKIRDLLFHLTCEVYRGAIKQREDVQLWWEKTFARILTGRMWGYALQAFDALQKSDVIRFDGRAYETTRLGRIVAQMFFYPDDVADWHKRWQRVFDEGLAENDFAIAWALVHPSLWEQADYVSADDRKRLMEWFQKYGSTFPSWAREIGEVDQKYTMQVHWLLTNDGPKGTIGALRSDAERWTQALIRIDGEVAKWERRTYFNRLLLRLKYAIPWEATELVTVPGVGHARSLALLGRGIKSIADMAANPDAVLECCGKGIGFKVNAWVQAKMRGEIPPEVPFTPQDHDHDRPSGRRVIKM